MKPEGFLQRKFILQIAGGANRLDTRTVDLSMPVFSGGDINGSGTINSLDYARLLRRNTQVVNKINDDLADLDSSDQVNGIDFTIMASNWGRTDKS